MTTVFTVFVVTHNGQPEQVFATQEDASQYVTNASQGNGAEYNVQPFQLSALGPNGKEVVAA